MRVADSWRLSRRRVIGAILGSPILLATGCSPSRKLPPAGTIVGASRERGHQLRNRSPLTVADERREEVGVLIVGGGVAGLAAAWQLHRQGQRNFLVVELEDDVGGTSRGGRSTVSSYPWGAHYLPAPQAENRLLIDLLNEMGVVEEVQPDGRPRFREEDWCRDPEERLFVEGRWQEELFPEKATDEDRAEWQRFRQELDHWIGWRDDQGRRAFAIPSAAGSDHPDVRALDQISLADWLRQKQFRSPLVHWEIDYACRDDYGATPDQVSAWAGLFYFASRVVAPGEPSQPLLTWPEGNARLIDHLAKMVGGRIRTGIAVSSIERPGDESQPVRVTGLEARNGSPLGWLAQRVVYAAPQFTAPYVIAGYAEARGSAVRDFHYGSWLVANLHLRRRPAEFSFPLAWDNVIYESEGLGYVVATHQRGVDFGPTVFTYYRPVCDADPRAAREWLQRQSWEQCAELVLADLESAHPDLRELVDRLDVMQWGHAMIRPSVGFRFGQSRQLAAQPFGPIHFAHSDLSGLALFEEAFDQGVRAAEEVLGTLRH